MKRGGYVYTSMYACLFDFVGLRLPKQRKTETKGVGAKKKNRI